MGNDASPVFKHCTLKEMFKDMEDKTQSLEKTMLMFIESIKTMPAAIGIMQGKLPDHIDGEYLRWQAISKTNMQMAFLSVRRAIVECQVSLENSGLNKRSDDDDYVDATWNKYRTLKNKLDHEAVKEYWEEGDEDVLAQLFSGRAVQCSPEVLELLHQRKQAPIVVNKLKGE